MKRRTIFYTSFFTVFLFAYLMTIGFCDTHVAALQSYGYDVSLHYLPSIIRAIGFLSFFITRKLVPSEKGRSITILTVNTILFVSMLLLLSATPVIIVTAVFTVQFSIGHISGLIYYMMASALAGSFHKGKIIGLASAASILLQYIFTKIMHPAPTAVAITVLFAVVSYLSVRPVNDFILENPLPYAKETDKWNKNVHKQVILSCAVILFICIFAIRTDIAFASSEMAGEINISSYPRLFLIPGYLIMGFISDIRKEKVFRTAMFTGLLATSVIILTPFMTADLNALLCIYYLFVSIYIFSLTYSFLSLAPRTSRAELWAGFGRFFSDITVLLLYLCYTWANKLLGDIPVIISYGLYFLLMSVLYVLITYADWDPDIAMSVDENGVHESEEDEEVEDAQKIQDFLSDYPLTPREQEVAMILIQTDMPIKAVASSLGISERSTYRFTNSIYQKTETSDRIGLVKKYTSHVITTH